MVAVERTNRGLELLCQASQKSRPGFHELQLQAARPSPCRWCHVACPIKPPRKTSSAPHRNWKSRKSPISPQAVDLLRDVPHQMAPEVDLGEVGRWRETKVEADLDFLDFLIFMIDLHERTDIEIPELDYLSWQPFRGAPPAWLPTRKLRR
jgi:hypothetical protein